MANRILLSGFRLRIGDDNLMPPFTNGKGWRLQFYDASTTQPKAVYSGPDDEDASLGTIVELDDQGYVPVNGVWLSEGPYAIAVESFVSPNPLPPFDEIWEVRYTMEYVDGAPVDGSGTSSRYVSTVNELRGLTETAGAVRVGGYYDENDGGGGLFAWDSLSTITDDGGYSILPTSQSPAQNGRWIRIFEDSLHVRAAQWGALEGEPSAYTQFNRADTFATTNDRVLIVDSSVDLGAVETTIVANSIIRASFTNTPRINFAGTVDIQADYVFQDLIFVGELVNEYVKPHWWSASSHEEWQSVVDASIATGKDIYVDRSYTYPNSLVQITGRANFRFTDIGDIEFTSTTSNFLVGEIYAPKNHIAFKGFLSSINLDSGLSYNLSNFQIDNVSDLLDITDSSTFTLNVDRDLLIDSNIANTSSVTYNFVGGVFTFEDVTFGNYKVLFTDGVPAFTFTDIADISQIVISDIKLSNIVDDPNLALYGLGSILSSGKDLDMQGRSIFFSSAVPVTSINGVKVSNGTFTASSSQNLNWDATGSTVTLDSVTFYQVNLNATSGDWNVYDCYFDNTQSQFNTDNIEFHDNRVRNDYIAFKTDSAWVKGNCTNNVFDDGFIILTTSGLNLNNISCTYNTFNMSTLTGSEACHRLLAFIPNTAATNVVIAHNTYNNTNPSQRPYNVKDFSAPGLWDPSKDQDISVENEVVSNESGMEYNDFQKKMKMQLTKGVHQTTIVVAGSGSAVVGDQVVTIGESLVLNGWAGLGRIQALAFGAQSEYYLTQNPSDVKPVLVSCHGYDVGNIDRDLEVEYYYPLGTPDDDGGNNLHVSITFHKTFGALEE